MQVSPIHSISSFFLSMQQLPRADKCSKLLSQPDCLSDHSCLVYIKLPDACLSLELCGVPSSVFSCSKPSVASGHDKKGIHRLCEDLGIKWGRRRRKLADGAAVKELMIFFRGRLIPELCKRPLVKLTQTKEKVVLSAGS